MEPEMQELMESTAAAMFEYLRRKLRAKKWDKDSDEYNIVSAFIDDAEADMERHMKKL